MTARHRIRFAGASHDPQRARHRPGDGRQGTHDGAFELDPPGISVDLADCFAAIDRIERSGRDPAA